ncbi:MAG: DUF1295 domain-containing protein [Planctomycetes bacterium]|nr:DUF1295 domain-containing protein [Planctomycetota bacterium]
MHGQEEVSKAPRIVWTLGHLAILGATAWLLFGGGLATVGGWLGKDWTPGDPVRRGILVAFGGFLWIRMTMTAFVLLRRKFGWDEAGSVLSALALYQIGFALMGGGSDAPVGVLDWAGVAVYLLGSYLNTGSEYQRKLFKAKPENKGKLYTQGLFGLARHINYTGDVLWAAGWAMVTHNKWAGLVPLALFLAFAFMFVPGLTKYLSGKYGDEFQAWAKKTKKLIPFVF